MWVSYLPKKKTHEHRWVIDRKNMYTDWPLTEKAKDKNTEKYKNIYKTRTSPADADDVPLVISGISPTYQY